MDFEAAFAAALAHHNARRFAEAEALYREILLSQPGHAASLHQLGRLALQTGRGDEAITLMLRAIDCGKLQQLAEFHAGAAFAYRRQGDRDGAAQHYRQWLALAPDSVDAHLNLGAVLREQGPRSFPGARDPSLSAGATCAAEMWFFATFRGWDMREG